MIIGSVALLPSAGMAESRVVFSSCESIERELVRLLDTSRESIDLALFRFSSRPLAKALRRAGERGVRIRVLTDGHREPGHAPSVRPLGIPGAARREIQGRRGRATGLMHHKFVLVDGLRLATGSFNWTSGAEHANYENIILTEERPLVDAFREEFARLWDRAGPRASAPPLTRPWFAYRSAGPRRAGRPAVALIRRKDIRSRRRRAGER